MRILLMPVGSSGDVHPFVGLGIRLRQRGHRVEIVTNGYFRSLVERSGLIYREASAAEDYLAVMKHPDLWHPTRSLRTVIGCEPMVRGMRQQVELLRDEHREVSVVAAGSLALGARVARDLYDFPLVTIHLQPVMLRSLVAPPIQGPIRWPAWAPRALVRGYYWVADRGFADAVFGDVVEPLRQAHGLPRLSRYLQGWVHSPDRVIGLFPPWYAHAPDWPDQVRLTGFPLFDERTEAPLPGAIRDFLDRGDPPVVVTFGSGMCQGERYFAAAAEALRRLRRRGILLTPFREQVPAELPPGILHVPYVPFSQILPHAAAVIHHGGIGSSAQGLAAGIPQLIMPLAHDQPDNAFRLRALGLARVVPAARFRAPAVARALRKLLDDPAHARAAQAIAQRFHAIDPLAETCALIEAMARRE